MNGFVVGLTGGIGSGKSAAAAIFAELGAAVVDTDAIAREVTSAGGAAMPALAEAFGAAFVAADGGLDRATMRKRAFDDAAVRGRLESILHPLIRVESERRCAAALEAGAPYVVLVVPLLVESGDYRRRVGRVVVVDCAVETQLARVMDRNGFPRAEAEKIMAAQATREERKAAADDVIDNEGDWAHLRRQAEALHRRYLEMAAMSPAS